MSSSVLTVSQVNSYIKLLIDGDKNLKSVFVCGEISNFNNNYRSGHLYFSLKDDKSVIKAVMFASNASRLRFIPSDGMRVIVSGRISVYEATGQYQLYVDSMQPDGIGSLAIAYEQLKNKLQAQGYFDEEHKIPIPQFPKNIGVITSPTGAVIQDIKNVVSRRYPLANVILCPVAVQGEFAATQLTKAVQLFNELNNVDVIIIGRGGGSFEDLNCFNDENLVKEIFNCNIPIISAVGHETDFTLCDFAADMRAPTPSAAAELAVPDKAELIKSVDDLYSKICYSVDNKINTETQSVDKLSDIINSLTPENYIINERANIFSISKNINTMIQNKLKLERADITAVANKINTLNPISLLQRGYSIVYKNNTSVNSITQILENDNVSIKLSDGTLDCTVTKIN